MMYNELVECYFFNPIHVGTLDLSCPGSVHYRSGNKAGMGIVDFYLLCAEDGQVMQARFKACGHPYLIAGAELVCRRLQGDTIQNHPQFDYRWFMAQLGLGQVHFPYSLQIETGYRLLVLKMKEKLMENSLCLS